MARRTYPIWHASFTYLFRLHGRSMRLTRPDNFDTLVEVGQGSPARRRRSPAWLQDQIEQIGANYIVGQFAFGDMTLDKCRRSITLFADVVMPALRTKARAA